MEVVELGQLDVDGGGDGEEEDAEAAAAGVEKPQQVRVRVQAAAGTVQYKSNTVQYKSNTLQYSTCWCWAGDQEDPCTPSPPTGSPEIGETTQYIKLSCELYIIGFGSCEDLIVSYSYIFIMLSWF